jgi:hypothetical protein
MNLPLLYQPCTVAEHRTRVAKLLHSLSNFPKGDYRIKHIFSDDSYIRQITMTASTMIVGAIHLKESCLIMMKGRIRVITEDGPKEYSAPNIIVSPPGTQRVIIAIEDTVFCNVFTTRNAEVETAVLDFTSDKRVIENSAGRIVTFIKGKRLKDEEYQPSSKRLTRVGSLQQLPLDNDQHK